MKNVMVIYMKTLKEAIQCICWFAGDLDLSVIDAGDFKKLYKKAALLVHSDRISHFDCPYTMVDVNNAWEITSKAGWLAVANQLGLSVQVSSNASFAWENDPLHEASVPSFFSVATLSRKEWQFTDSKREDFSWFGFAHCTYFEDLKWEYRYWAGSESMCLTDLTNALLFKRTCISYRIVSNSRFSRGVGIDSSEAFYRLFNDKAGGYSPSAVISWLRNLEMQDLGKGYGFGAVFNIENIEIKIYREETQSHKVFTPFNLERMKPLTELPKKWTIAHLRRILANGQFTKLKQNYYLTDDYAHDAAVNSRKGYIQNPIKMLVGLVGDDLGHLYASTNDSGECVISFGYHSNDGRSVKIDLNNRYPLVDMEKEETEYLSGSIDLRLLAAG